MCTRYAQAALISHILFREAWDNFYENSASFSNQIRLNSELFIFIASDRSSTLSESRDMHVLDRKKFHPFWVSSPRFCTTLAFLPRTVRLSA